MTEIRFIHGYDNQYLIDSLGEVFSLKSNKRLKSIRMSDGYLKVNLSHRNRRFERKIHQLVLETFVGPRPEGFVACHYDDNRSNNQLSNLRWASYTENARDSMRNGTARCANQRGTANHMCKLSESDVRLIRSAEGQTQLEIAEAFNISQSHVSNLRSGRRR